VHDVATWMWQQKEGLMFDFFGADDVLQHQTGTQNVIQVDTKTRREQNLNLIITHAGWLPWAVALTAVLTLLSAFVVTCARMQTFGSMLAVGFVWALSLGAAIMVCACLCLCLQSVSASSVTLCLCVCFFVASCAYACASVCLCLL
jgi:hypothetical protein